MNIGQLAEALTVAIEKRDSTAVCTLLADHAELLRHAKLKEEHWTMLEPLAAQLRALYNTVPVDLKAKSLREIFEEK